MHCRFLFGLPKALASCFPFSSVGARKIATRWVTAEWGAGRKCRGRAAACQQDFRHSRNCFRMENRALFDALGRHLSLSQAAIAFAWGTLNRAKRRMYAKNSFPFIGGRADDSGGFQSKPRQ